MSKRSNTWDDVVYGACVLASQSNEKMFDKKSLLSRFWQYMESLRGPLPKSADAQIAKSLKSLQTSGKIISVQGTKNFMVSGNPAPSPSPSYPAPSPSYPAPSPSYPAPSPSYPAPSPSYPAPSPSYPAPSPSYPAPSPPFNSQNNMVIERMIQDYIKEINKLQDMVNVLKYVLTLQQEQQKSANIMPVPPAQTNHISQMSYSQIPSLPNINPQVPSLPNINSQLPSLPNINSQVPTLPSLPNINSQLPSLPNVNSQLPSLPTVNSQLPSLPTVNSQLPSLPTVNSQLPSLPSLPNVNSQVPSLPNVNSQVPNINIELPAKDSSDIIDEDDDNVDEDNNNVDEDIDNDGFDI